ncbi:MAG: hypothetical protein HW380_2251 [Magnetococcales bacterium]|nr:hypothetical protein [Magnetococcales bacterium]HIJ82982.1 hypothetical protein [Magnetococcales bacterium]
MLSKVVALLFLLFIAAAWRIQTADPQAAPPEITAPLPDPVSRVREGGGDAGTIKPLIIDHEVFTIVLDNIPIRDLLLTLFSGLDNFRLVLSPDLEGAVSLKVYRVTLGEMLRSLVDLEKITYIYNESTRTLTVLPKRIPEKRSIAIRQKHIPKNFLHDVIAKFGFQELIQSVEDKDNGIVLLHGNKTYIDQVEKIVTLYEKIRWNKNEDE